MPKFKLFAGLGGGFGGPEYYMTEEYPNRDAAMKDAYDLAVEKYESYEGYHGILSWDDVYQDLIDSGFIDTISDREIEEMVDDAYQEAMEGWLTYNAIPVQPGEKETDSGYTDYNPSVLYKEQLTYPCQYCGECGVWWASGEEPGFETLEKTIAYCKDVMKCPIVGTPVSDEIINHPY